MTKPAKKAAKKVVKKAVKKSMTKKPWNPKRNENGVVILSGGNPQIATGEGDAPVQEYIRNMPGWKRAVGERLDTLITKNAPRVKKAVKWNSPFYGSDEQGWFASFHVLTKYVKVTFFNGVHLTPMPPGATEKSGESRWLDIYETDALDEKLFAAWVKQAAKIPGWNGK